MVSLTQAAFDQAGKAFPAVLQGSQAEGNQAAYYTITHQLPFPYKDT